MQQVQKSQSKKDALNMKHNVMAGIELRKKTASVEPPKGSKKMTYHPPPEMSSDLKKPLKKRISINSYLDDKNGSQKHSQDKGKNS
jgi:hypothetical protein